MEKSANQVALENRLKLWEETIETQKLEFLEIIKWQVSKHLLAKIDAIQLINYYELLPLNWCLVYPEFMEDTMDGEEYERKEAIEFYTLLDIEDNFLPEDGSEIDKWAKFPEITYKEAINLTYDFMIENEIRGCHFDW